MFFGTVETRRACGFFGYATYCSIQGGYLNRLWTMEETKVTRY